METVAVEAAIAEIVHINISFNYIIIFVLALLFEESTNVTGFDSSYNLFHTNSKNLCVSKSEMKKKCVHFLVNNKSSR
jgi:hypothetical protein